MIDFILIALKNTESKSELVRFAKGSDKFPNTFKEFINTLKQNG